MPRIADYDKQSYDYTQYWQDAAVGRDYEDQAERIAIARLLPEMSPGVFFLDLGGGFGRLTTEYASKYQSLILSDYSLENLRKAKNQADSGQRIADNYVALNAYHLPFRPGTIDGLQTVRMMHHIEDAPQVISEIARVVSLGGSAVIEYANKRHFLSMLRYIFTRRGLNPFSLEPQDHSDLFYNFHPKQIESTISSQQLTIKRTLSVSNLRHRIFKKLLPMGLLLFIERILQVLLASLRFAPSIFVLAQKERSADSIQYIAEKSTEFLSILQCPKCQSTGLGFENTQVICRGCNRIYPIIDGIYDFRVD